MRFSAVAIAAALIAVANAKSDYFPFPREGACVEACTDLHGKARFPEYNDVDEYGPRFIESLSYSYDSSSDKYGPFMNDVGGCISSCPGTQLMTYADLYPQKKKWYDDNKLGTPPTRPVDPAFPFTPNGPCVAACTLQAGRSLNPNYSEDPKSPYFWQSMAYYFVPGSNDNNKFMTSAGFCMVPCPQSELDLFQNQFSAQVKWYNANKPSTTVPTTTVPTTTTTAPPVVTTLPPGVDPAYPFQPNGPCVNTCVTTVGKKMFPNFSEDPKSPYFWESLAYSFESGSPNTRNFMMDVGMCQGVCPAAENALYSEQFYYQKQWYLANKPKATTVAPTVPTTTITTTTTTSGPVPTGPVNPGGGFDYPFKPNGPCVSACTNKIGKEMFPNYSEDPKSPYFIQSLSYSFESGSENTGKFMSGVGRCQGVCPAAENQLYLDQFQDQKA
ncbi:hypothetical protein BGZ96_012107, partial [Linnemannia gamsii]